MGWEKFPDDLVHEGSTRSGQMEKYKFIGYEHCSTTLILKVKKYALAELIFSSLPGRGFILSGPYRAVTPAVK
jgi:hypothetical protein